MPERQIDPGHSETRGCLRVLGPMLIILGGGFMLVGMVDFFASFGGWEGPQLFWCCFVGMPLLFAGFVTTSYGYMGKVARYQAGEMAPVAKDTFNYLADGTQEGVETVSSAISRGLAHGVTSDTASVACPRCGEANDPDAKFCDHCGAPLTRTCPSCGEANAPDAKFCDHCGQALS